VLIDDVRTSGATMREAARALHEAGVHWIAGVSVAYERD
jgi:predicted amidophosphoribosyltransferase